MVREELLPGGPAWLSAAVGSEFTPPAASAPARRAYKRRVDWELGEPLLYHTQRSFRLQPGCS